MGLKFPNWLSLFRLKARCWSMGAVAWEFSQPPSHSHHSPNGRHPPPTNRHIHPKSHAELTLPISRKASRCRRRNKRCKSGGYAAAHFEESAQFFGRNSNVWLSRVFPTSGGSSGRARAPAQGSWLLQYNLHRTAEKYKYKIQNTNTKQSHKMPTKMGF